MQPRPLHQKLATFPGMFGDVPQNFWWHSPKYLATFPGMFGGIPRNIWWHSAECLMTFSGMLDNIPRNIWRHSPECLRTFPRMFSNIPRNTWRHSPEYNIPTIPCIPFPFPVFLVLYIAVLSPLHSMIYNQTFLFVIDFFHNNTVNSHSVWF